MPDVLRLRIVPCVVFAWGSSSVCVGQAAVCCFLLQLLGDGEQAWLVVCRDGSLASEV